MEQSTGTEDIFEKLEETCGRVERIERSVMPLLELREDLQPVINEAFRALIVELDELDGHFRTEDALFLVKKLLRNTRNLTAMLEHLEQLNDFVVDATPLLTEAMAATITELGEMERKGLFRTVKAWRTAVERFSGRYSTDQIVAMGDQMSILAGLFERLAQPRVVAMAGAAVDALASESPPREGVTMFGLWRRMRDPATLRGMALLLDLCRALGQADEVDSLPRLEESITRVERA